MRQNYEVQLLDIKKKISVMGDMVKNAIERSILSLEHRDMELAQTVIEGDLNINLVELETEQLCTRLMATQQPLAKDLRKLVSACKIIIYLERMGDLAVDMAKTSKRIGSVPLMKPLVDLPLMVNHVIEMIDRGIDAYIREDMTEARAMAKIDHTIDGLYKKTFKDLFDLMAKDPSLINQGMYLLFVGRYIERIGDYCTNIAEETIYIVSGSREDLNED